LLTLEGLVDNTGVALAILPVNEPLALSKLVVSVGVNVQLTVYEPALVLVPLV
jgi:hypothetical protein